MVFATNAIYYFTAFPGYSHCYSFFLVSVFLYLSEQYSKKQKIACLYILALVMALMLINRPINILLAATFFIFNDWKTVWKILSLKHIVLMLLIIFAVILPQLLYYHYLTGSFMAYPYSNERFHFEKAPFITEFWFSFYNGLFTYNPIWFLFVFIALFLALKKIRTGYFTILIFVVFSYVLASWHAWTFGCGYGSRNFVDYLPVFAVALAVFYQKYLNKKIVPVLLIAVFIGVSTLYNFKLMKNYEKCFFGGNYWDSEFFKNEILLK